MTFVVTWAFCGYDFCEFGVGFLGHPGNEQVCSFIEDPRKIARSPRCTNFPPPKARPKFEHLPKRFFSQSRNYRLTGRGVSELRVFKARMISSRGFVTRKGVYYGSYPGA